MAKLYFHDAAMNAGKSAVYYNLTTITENRAKNLLFTIVWTIGTARKDYLWIGLQRPAYAFENLLIFCIYSKKHQETKEIVFSLMRHNFSRQKGFALSLSSTEEHSSFVLWIKNRFSCRTFSWITISFGLGRRVGRLKTISQQEKAMMNIRLSQTGERMWSGEQVEIGHNYQSVTKRV